MKIINRSVLVLKPTEKMLDWINSVGEECAAVTPEEAQEMTDAYLLPASSLGGPTPAGRGAESVLQGVGHPPETIGRPSSSRHCRSFIETPSSVSTPAPAAVPRRSGPVPSCRRQDL